ncbi:uncharacterized protein LOC119991437 [Tripterygium wilfordii]|uniref:uncharacterized protein LOC119991437 n=1 Tax=Tripterygium wilfordii TaxID=458696 RepID=UPI0018F813EE|nr:uncharacterized protein LOC119991437 [Tripterygium wilfordii]
MKSAPRRTQAPNVPLTTVSQETQSIVVNTGGDGLDDDSDEVLDAFMESLEQNDVGIDGVDVIDGVGEELDAEGSDEGEGEGDGSSDDDPDFKVVYESDNEDILLYESDSDDEVRMRKAGNARYDPKEVAEQYIFELGMEFKTIFEFKNAVRSYAVDGGYQIHFVRNEKNRCQAKCVVGCPWNIWWSKIRGQETFQIKTYVRRHKCNRRLPNKQANSSWLSLRLVDKVRGDPKISASALVTYVKEKMSLSISRTHAYRSKTKALEIIDGKHKEQYGKLRSYMAEILRTNSGSSCNIIVDRERPEDPAVFKKAYMCLAPLRDGFLAGCRPLIGLDGCFLKTTYGGQLLTTVAHYGCNGIFPIAWAVVENENGDSWDWFLRKLLLDIGGIESRRWA